MDYHTLVSLYDAHSDAVSELEHACEHDKLERCYKSIIEFQDNKDKEPESK